MLAAFLTTIFFAASAVSGARATKWMGGTEANFWRLCVATLLLGIYAYTIGQATSAGFAVLLVSGCIGFGLGDLALFQGYKRIGSRLTILLVQCLAAPFAALTEWLWLGTTLTWLQMLCALVILGGVGMALAPGGHLEVTRRTLAAGVVFGLIAAYGQGLGAVLSRKAYEVIADSGESIDGISAAYQRIIGGVLVSGVFLLFLKRSVVWGRLTGAADVKEETPVNPDRWRKGWHLVIINGLAGPALGVSCYQWALKTTPTGIVLPIVAMTPLVVVPMTRILEGEKPTTRSLIGGFIAVAGVIGLTLATVRP
ncbi:MAG: DMT family transporter [Verrucomicrobiota bacterium]